MKSLRPKQFKTKIDDKGRVCTKCGEYKLWKEFNTASTKKILTKKSSSCKKCKREYRKAVGRNCAREKYCAKSRREELKKIDFKLVKSSDIRGSLLSRVKLPEYKALTPTKNQIYEWLKEPLYCYYSKELLDIKKITIDHKIPISRGGTNELTNLCIASHKMNSAKGDMTEQEFVQLLNTISTWEDGGIRVLKRLRQGYF